MKSGSKPSPGLSHTGPRGPSRSSRPPVRDQQGKCGPRQGNLHGDHPQETGRRQAFFKDDNDSEPGSVNVGGLASGVVAEVGSQPPLVAGGRRHRGVSNVCFRSGKIARDPERRAQAQTYGRAASGRGETVLRIFPERPSRAVARIQPAELTT